MNFSNSVELYKCTRHTRETPKGEFTNIYLVTATNNPLKKRRLEMEEMLFLCTVLGSTVTCNKR